METVPPPGDRLAASIQRARRLTPQKRPAPVPNASNLIVVVLDSLRFDSFVAAQPKYIQQLGDLQRRWSYASWTAPSHYNLLMGLFPHSSPSHTHAADYYKQDFLKYIERLGVEGIEFKGLLPSLFLPSFLRNKLGYRTHAMVSMPVLNPNTVLNRDFDTYELMPSHNDMAAMLPHLHFDDARPAFYLLNVGETHYPYALPDEDMSRWPRISGVHGVFKNLDEQVAAGLEPGGGSNGFFDEETMRELQARQVASVRYLDGVFENLYDIVPRNTWLVVTSDHGELFGEGGYFGHGPILHEKVLEVPFIEGRLR